MLDHTLPINAVPPKSAAHSPVYALAANTPTTVGVTVSAFRLDPPPAGTPNAGPLAGSVFTVNIGDEANFVVTPGTAYNLDSPTTLRSITASVGQAMQLTYVQRGTLTSNILLASGAVASSVTVVNTPLPIEYTGGSTENFPTIPNVANPLNTLSVAPLGGDASQTHAAYTAGYTWLFGVVSAQTATDQFVTLNYGTLKIIVVTAPTETVTVQDEHGQAMPLYTANGAAPTFSIPTSVAVGTEYWVPCVGNQYTSLIAGTATGSFYVTAYTHPWTPPLVPTPASLFAGQTLKFFRSTTVAGGAVTTLVPAVAGQSVYVLKITDACPVAAAGLITEVYQDTATNFLFGFAYEAGYISEEVSSNSQIPYLFATVAGNGLAVNRNGTTTPAFINVWYYQF